MCPSTMFRQVGARASRSSWRRGPNSRCRAPTNARAPGVSTSSNAASIAPYSSTLVSALIALFLSFDQWRDRILARLMLPRRRIGQKRALPPGCRLDRAQAAEQRRDGGGDHPSRQRRSDRVQDQERSRHRQLLVLELSAQPPAKADVADQIERD